MSVKILLLDPPHKIFGGLRMWMPSPGIMALAAYLEVHNLSVEILDATTLERPWTDLEQHLINGQYDMVGVTCSAATFHNDALASIRLIRKCLPKAVIVSGGGHMSNNAERIFARMPELDYIVMGEGEETFLALIQWLVSHEKTESCRIPGLMCRTDEEGFFSGPRPLIPDLDILPMPAYHKMDLDNPTYYLHGMGRRAVGISTSRGCGDRCSYCSEAVLWNSSWRGRGGELVVEEMKMLNRDYGKSLFVFNENSFNQSRVRNESFLEHLGRSGLNCDFWFQSRIRDILRDRDLLDEFKRLGCYEVMLGVESITPETLKNYTKKQTFEEIREAVELVRSRGMMVMTNVMFGDRDDTEETLKDIYEFVSKNGDFLVLTLTTPLPGTRYYAQAMEEGRIEDTDYSHYDFMHPIVRNLAYERNEILALQKKYLKKYYTRPTIFYNMLFSGNPFKRMAYKLIMRYAWYEARNREWVQPNYEKAPSNLF